VAAAGVVVVDVVVGAENLVYVMRPAGIR
jgi:hypothetical protein